MITIKTANHLNPIYLAVSVTQDLSFVSETEQQTFFALLMISKLQIVLNLWSVLNEENDD